VRSRLSIEAVPPERGRRRTTVRYEDAAPEEEGRDDEEGQKRVERKPGEEGEGRVRPEHQDPGVGEIDDAHDPVDHREAIRHCGVQTRGEEGVDDDV